MPGIIAPPPIGEPLDSFAWQQWYMSLANLYSATGAIPWASIDFTGSDLTDIANRLHNDLQSIQGGTTGEYYHLTSAQHTALTGIFKTIAISGQTDVVADALDDTLTLAAGSNITLTTNAATDTITITASGLSAFGTVAVSGQSDVVADSVNDTLTLAAGSNITITTNAGTDTVTIAASGGNAFGTIAVSGQSDVVADTGGDTLTLAAGSNITITTNAGTDTVTIAASASGGTNLGLVLAITRQLGII